MFTFETDARNYLSLDFCKNHIGLIISENINDKVLLGDQSIERNIENMITRFIILKNDLDANFSHVKLYFTKNSDTYQATLCMINVCTEMLGWIRSYIRSTGSLCLWMVEELIKGSSNLSLFNKHLRLMLGSQ
jgi:hypothetical protein